MPHNLRESERVLELNTLYELKEPFSGLSNHVKPTLEVFPEVGGAAGTIDLYESNFFDLTYTPTITSSRMEKVLTNSSGIHIFNTIPNFIYAKSNDGTACLLTSGLSVKRVTTVPLEGSIFLNKKELDSPFLELLSLGAEADFPLARPDTSGLDSKRHWSVRTVFKLKNSFNAFSYSNNANTEKIEIIVGDNLVKDTRNVSGQIKLRYGLNDDFLIFGNINDLSHLIYDRWYQLVISYDGGGTFTPAESVTRFEAHLTDLVTQTTTLLPKDVSNCTISFGGDFQYPKLKINVKGIPDLNEFGGVNNAIVDVWDGVLSLADIKKLALNVEYAREPLVVITSADLFKGWAMRNVVDPLIPFFDPNHLHDYVYFVQNVMANPDITYSFIFNNITDKNFTSSAPPSTTTV